MYINKVEFTVKQILVCSFKKFIIKFSFRVSNCVVVLLNWIRNNKKSDYIILIFY